MNRVQFLDSLRRQLDDLPSRQREEIVETFSAHIAEAIAGGVSERDAISQLGAPAVCARNARAGRLPAPTASAAVPRKGSNPFEPQMAAKPQRIRAQKQERQRQRQREEPRGKKPWALVIVVTLAALLCVGFVILRMLSSDDHLGYAAREKSFSLAEVQNIVVEDSGRDIRVSALTTSDVRINYFEGHHISYILTLEDGTLYIRSRSDRRWYDTLLSFYDSTIPVLNLYLPPDFAGSLALTTSEGDIEVLGPLQAADLALCSSNGSLSITGLSLNGDLTAATSAAPITLENVIAEDISLTDSNGALTLQNVDSTTLTLRTANGTIRAFELSERIQTLDWETSNASVLGSIHGSESAFTIDAETTNSRNEMTNRTGGNRNLRIRTSNGTIDVDFIA